MNSESSYTIKTKIVGITPDNTQEKFKLHFTEILEAVKALKFENVKVTTRLDSMSLKEVMMYSQITEVK